MSAETASGSQSETLRLTYSPTATSAGTAQETRQKLILRHLSIKDYPTSRRTYPNSAMQRFVTLKEPCTVKIKLQGRIQYLIEMMKSTLSRMRTTCPRGSSLSVSLETAEWRSWSHSKSHCGETPTANLLRSSCESKGDADSTAWNTNQKWKWLFLCCSNCF